MNTLLSFADNNFFAYEKREEDNEQNTSHSGAVAYILFYLLLCQRVYT